jgi:hypothetical protein
LFILFSPKTSVPPEINSIQNKSLRKAKPTSISYKTPQKTRPASSKVCSVHLQ